MRRRTVPLLVAVAAAFMLTACGGASSDSMEAVAPAAVSDGMAVEGGAPVPSEGMVTSGKEAAPQVGAPIDRQVIRTGYLNMSVEDVAKGAFDVITLVKRNNGLIASEDTSTNGDFAYSTITAQVPAASLDAFIADVSKLGTVESVNISAQDVTTQVVDLDARIKAMKTSIDRMTQLMAQATRIEDLLAIETQLSSRQGELDSMTAQRTYLADQVALSTITVALSPMTEIASIDAPGFLSGLQSGWAALVSAASIAITALGFFLPFLLILLIIVVPTVVIAVRQNRHHRKAAPIAAADPIETTGTNG